MGTVKKKVTKTKVEKSSLPNSSKTSTAKKKVGKKKASKKVAKKKGFSLDDIATDLKAFDVRIMSKDAKKKSDKIPYKIPFRHKALQSITGGILGGKFIEISGNSQAGKSFLAYELIAEVQKMGGFVLLFDGERAWDDTYAPYIGIDMDSGTFIISYETDMDKIFPMMNKFVNAIRAKKRKAPILMITDSYPTMQISAEIKNIAEAKKAGEMSHMQKNGRFSKYIEKYKNWFASKEATYVLLNQTRNRTDIGTGITKTITLCEEVVQFHADQRIQGILSGNLVKEVKSIENKKGKINIKIGVKTVWTAIKNRYVKPFQKALTKIYYENGLEEYSGLAELLVNRELIRTSGTKFEFDGTEIAGNKKPIQGFRLFDDTGAGEFYYYIEHLIEDYPEFAEPLWTGTVEKKKPVIEVDSETGEIIDRDDSGDVVSVSDIEDVEVSIELDDDGTPDVLGPEE